jgi:hypothetical protein
VLDGEGGAVQDALYVVGQDPLERAVKFGVDPFDVVLKVIIVKLCFSSELIIV